MGTRQVTPPDAVEPVSLDEVKEVLRVEHDDDDAMLAIYLSSAREFLENRIGRKLALATWELVIDAFPSGEIMLPFGPVVSVESIKYDDALGDETTLNPASYELDNTSPNAWVFSASDWPATLESFNAVRITFIAGYEEFSQVPPQLKGALFLKIKELYDDEDTREAVHNLLTNYYTMVA